MDAALAGKAVCAGCVMNPRRISRGVARAYQEMVNGVWTNVESGAWFSSFACARNDWEICDENQWVEVPARDVIARVEDEPGLDWEYMCSAQWFPMHTTPVACVGGLYRCRRRDTP